MHKNWEGGGPLKSISNGPHVVFGGEAVVIFAEIKNKEPARSIQGNSLGTFLCVCVLSLFSSSVHALLFADLSQWNLHPPSPFAPPHAVQAEKKCRSPETVPQDPRKTP